MLFDAQLQVAQLEIATVDEVVQLGMLLALGLPVSPQQVMAIPAGVLRFGLSKEDAIKYGKELQEAGENLPDEKPKSDIVVATNLAGVDAAVQQVENLTGKAK